jgi:hypothetical protein
MKRPLALLACILLIFGACSSDDDDRAGGTEAGGKVETASTTAPTATTVPPVDVAPVGPDITVTASEYAFEAPRVVYGGVVNLTFRNAGKLRHEALIVKVGDTPQATVIDDLVKFVDNKGQPIPAYLDLNGGVGAIAQKTEDKTSLSLPAGEYAIVCTLTDLDSVGGAPVPEGLNAPEHFTKKMYAPLTVRGDQGGTLPPSDGTIVARDHAFELPAFKAGPRTYTFRNDGPAQPHFAALGVFPEGVDAATGRKALETLFQATAGAPPPAGTPQPADVTFVAPLRPKSSETFQVNLEAGRTYSVMCFLWDREGGPPHAIDKKMFAVFTVPG